MKAREVIKKYLAVERMVDWDERSFWTYSRPRCRRLYHRAEGPDRGDANCSARLVDKGQRQRSWKLSGEGLLWRHARRLWR